MDNVLLNKAQVIRRCVSRIREEYADDAENLADLTKQDSIVLNIQRACECAIDLAMHVVASKSLGLPQNSREAFEILHRQGLLSEKMTYRMKMMVGFRNVAIHDYQSIDFDVVQSIIEKHLADIVHFSDEMLRI